MKTYLPYRTYITHLNSLVHDAAADKAIDKEAFLAQVNAALDGEASRELRKRISIEDLRQDGAFFTSTQLADAALLNIKHDSVYCDSACGAGDLLVACARKLPIKGTLAETLEQWGAQLIGRDIHEEFVQAARARIALTAILRGTQVPRHQLSLEKMLPNIRTGNSLLDANIYKKCSHIVINPPFTIAQAPRECKWASGVVNSAALFIEATVIKAQDQTRITAILPEVLRTGSRYGKWREYISGKIKINKIKSFGQFDKNVDVDVFVLDGVISDTQKNKSKWWLLSADSTHDTVENLFEVHVGPVVPHRHPCRGKLYPYIHAKNVTPWADISRFTEKRKFKGTTFKPPFIVIRRTSRPGDKYRASGCIIMGSQAVAVENHLIVCRPKNEKLSECRRLLSYLKSEVVNQWLNERIRCRHLTVSSIKELPLMRAKYE